MAHIVTLKDNNDEISYPITPVDAVFVDSNTTLTDALDDKADADLSNVASGAITGAKIASNTVTASNLDLTTLGGNYSTTEVDTGFTWIDGKTIYKKTVNFGALPNNTSKSVAHNISNLDTIINIQGISISTTGRVKTLPMVEYNAVFVVPMSVYAGNIEITTYSDLSAYTRTYVTLYYTKSS